MAIKIQREEAEALWASLRDALTNLEEAIRAVIDAKAWRPLGCETLAEAWDARMNGVNLANSVKPYVIYAMLDEGLALEDVVRVTGWGADQVGRAAEDFHAGVPVDGATVVRQHTRRAPGERRTVHVTFESDEYLWLRDFARRQGRDIARESRLAIVAHFEALEAEAEKRRAS
jgi:hypothetical protein